MPRSLLVLVSPLVLLVAAWGLIPRQAPEEISLDEIEHVASEEDPAEDKAETATLGVEEAPVAARPEEPVAGEKSRSGKPVRQYERRLRLRNNTGEKMMVRVQYYTRDEDGKWGWLPAGPGETDEAIEIVLGAGKSVDVEAEEEGIHASRIRIWATDLSGRKYGSFARHDFWLVAEQNEDEDAKADEGHYYRAPEMSTHTYTFGDR